MSLDAVTVAVATVGRHPDTDEEVAVPAGAYAVDDVDRGEAICVLVGAMPAWVTPEACGLTTCPACQGRGQFGYRVYDDWETEECEDCDGSGLVTPAKAAGIATLIEEYRHHEAVAADLAADRRDRVSYDHGGED